MNEPGLGVGLAELSAVPRAYLTRMVIAAFQAASGGWLANPGRCPGLNNPGPSARKGLGRTPSFDVAVVLLLDAVVAGPTAWDY